MESKKQNSSIIWALVCLVIIIAAFALTGIFLSNKSPEYIQGQMEAAEYRVSSKVPGRILYFNVKEGDYVKAGDTLAVLEAPEVSHGRQRKSRPWREGRTTSKRVRNVAESQSRSRNSRKIL